MEFESQQTPLQALRNKAGTKPKCLLKAKILFQMFKLWLKVSTRIGCIDIYLII